jgi:hypothetical protein
LALLVPLTSKGEFQNGKHLIRKETFWGDFKTKRIEEKIYSATPQVIDYLIQDNIKNRWPNKPTPATLTDDYQKELIDALRELPPEIVKKINKKLTAILLVNDLGGSAYTESVFDNMGSRSGGFVILDVTVLNRKANEWATWKERSPFKTDKEIQIFAEIATGKNDNRKNALQFVLLHEFGHVASIGLATITPWDTDPSLLEPLSRFTFTSLSWQLTSNQLTTLFDGKALDRTGLRYYGPEESRLESTKSFRLYDDLKKTNFPTLYSATNHSDDFAESFATYIHSVKMKRPWQIIIQSYGKKNYKFGLCWNEERCRKKRKVLEQILVEL